MVEFWQAVFVEAYRATRSTVGHTEATVLFGFLCIAFAALWVLLEEGWQAMKATIAQAVIGAPLLVALLFFLWFLLIQVPYERFDEERRRADNAVQLAKEKDATIESQKNTIQQLEATRKEQPKVVYREKQSSANDAELARLRAESDQRAKRKEVRAEIAKFLNEGENIRLSLLVKEERPDLFSKAEDWNVRTHNYLKSVDLSYAARFNTATGLSYAYGDAHKANQNVVNNVRYRLDTLRGTLSELGN